MVDGGGCCSCCCGNGHVVGGVGVECEQAGIYVIFSLKFTRDIRK